LLLSAKESVAEGEYKAAQRDLRQIIDLYAAREMDVPIYADIMSALVDWNLGDCDATARSVRHAADKLGRQLAKQKQPAKIHELHYLRAYLWTLLYYSEARGAAVRWEDFMDLSPASQVNLAKISRTIREMFPVDEQVFVLDRS
jgi:hypothetical protein